MNEYTQQAKDFLNQTNTTFNAEFLKHGKHFADDKDNRDIYKITLKRGARVFSFNFGQSINNSGFYYTKGVQKTDLDRKYLKEPKNLGRFIKQTLDFSFLNNGKSDVIHYPKEPTEYDVLACLTKYEVGTLEDFCAEFGYDTDSKKAEVIYKAVLNEYQNVAMLWNDEEIELLSEIN